MSHFLISSILMQPQSMVHPTHPDSPLFFPTIHERPMSFSPPPACLSPKVPAAQRRKSTSFLEAQGRHSLSQLRTIGSSSQVQGGESLIRRPEGMLGKASVQAATEAVHRHVNHEGPVLADGRQGTTIPSDAHLRPVEAIYLASLPYTSLAETYSSSGRPGHMDEQKVAPLGSIYDCHTGQTYIARPLQSLRLEPGVNQPSPLGSISAPVTSDSHIMFHQVFVPQSAPPVLAQGSEVHPGCVFEFHVHTPAPASNDGAVYLPHRVYRPRRGSLDFNPEEQTHGSGLQSRLQTVTEEQCNHFGAEPLVPLIGIFKCSHPEGSPEYSSDSSQRNSSDPGDYLSPPTSGSLSSDISLPYTQKMFQDPQLFFCFPQAGAASYPGTTAAYNQQVIKEEFPLFCFSFACRVFPSIVWGL
ncbi:uncharacterized protein WCC33_005017 [Rhinophrynus dorsalis]